MLICAKKLSPQAIRLYDNNLSDDQIVPLILSKGSKHYTRPNL